MTSQRRAHRKKPSEKPSVPCPCHPGRLHRKSDLRRHLDMGTLNYHCPYTIDGVRCKKAYNQECSLNDHISIIHKKQKTRRCGEPDCEATFYTQYQFISHLCQDHPELVYHCRSHTGKGKKCHGFRGALGEDAMMRHIEKHHPGERPKTMALIPHGQPARPIFLVKLGRTLRPSCPPMTASSSSASSTAPSSPSPLPSPRVETPPAAYIRHASELSYSSGQASGDRTFVPSRPESSSHLEAPMMTLKQPSHPPLMPDIDLSQVWGPEADFDLLNDLVGLPLPGAPWPWMSDEEFSFRMALLDGPDASASHC